MKRADFPVHPNGLPSTLRNDPVTNIDIEGLKLDGGQAIPWRREGNPYHLNYNSPVSFEIPPDSNEQTD